MIPARHGTPQPRPWQLELARGFAHPDALLDYLGLSRDDFTLTYRTAHFPLRVPRGFAARMRRGDPRDPLLLQVLPLAAEDQTTAGFLSDPLAERHARAAPGILQKYHGRALLVTTGACAVHCRYCFRREFPYPRHSLTAGARETALQHLRASPEVREVILSGGDPLSLSNAKLRRLLCDLGDIPQLEALRIHTRLPIVLPERIDAELLALVARHPRPVVIVVHVNHANELEDDAVHQALGALRETGATLLNQSVLLRGVNDSSGALIALSRALFAAGVLPYYLHLLDRVRGTAHFEVPAERAILLHREAAARLPGYLVPRLVREIAGAPAKTPVAEGRELLRAGDRA